MRRTLKILKNKHTIPVVFVVFFALLASRTLIFQSGYFNMHDDLQMMRQLEMEKCFLDGQIPCRWVPDMGYGFGFPLFNFYPPLPYLIGQAIRLFGPSFITTVKLTFALSFIVSGITMYLLTKEFFGRIGGVFSSVFYIWAPYHAVDVYVRGAMNEAWALAWFPLILWSGYRLTKLSVEKEQKSSKFVIILTLSWFALLTSHNLMVLIFTPVFGLFILLHLWINKNWRQIPRFIVAGLTALGLAAFFTLPALAENKFTQIRSQLIGYYDYTAHFVNLDQLFFSRFWGYGPSVWGVVDDRMSFQIGHFHWILAAVVTAAVLARLAWLIYKRKGQGVVVKLKRRPVLLSVAFFIVVGWISSFMTHSKSTPIWLAVDQLKYVQFPWRFLALVILSFSFVVGVIPGVFAKWKRRHKIIARLAATIPQMFIVSVLLLSLILFNWDYFLPENGRMGPLTDEEKFSGAAWELQQTAGIYDYLPVYAETAPKESRMYLAEVMDGEGKVYDEESGTDWARFGVDIESEEALVRIGILKFPGWIVYVDGGETEIFLKNDEKWGRMSIRLPEGSYRVEARLHDTPVRLASNTISLISWLGLIGYLVWRKSTNDKE